MREKAWNTATSSVHEAEAREMCRRLAKEEGILAGTSTGLNVVGALQLAKEFGRGHTIATVAVDSGLKYLSSDLYTSATQVA
jgi:cysteine synthase